MKNNNWVITLKQNTKKNKNKKRRANLYWNLAGSDLATKKNSLKRRNQRDVGFEETHKEKLWFEKVKELHLYKKKKNMKAIYENAHKTIRYNYNENAHFRGFEMHMKLHII